jgi:DUF3060 family protein
MIARMGFRSISVLASALLAVGLAAGAARAQNADWFKNKARGASETNRNSAHGDQSETYGKGSGDSAYDDIGVREDGVGDFNPDRAAEGSGTQRGKKGAAANPVPADAKPLLIAGQKKRVTAECNKRNVTVTGLANRVLLKGSCGVLIVSGTRHEIAIEEVDMISVEGSENQITYTRGTGGKPPRIAQNGRKNSVKKAEP